MVCLSKGFVAMTQDPVVVTDQRGRQVLEKVQQDYLDEMKVARLLSTAGDRTMEAVIKS